MHTFGRNNCPAAGKCCNACKQLNHFAGSSVCPQKSVAEVEETAFEVDNLFLGSVDLDSEDEAKNETQNDWQIQMKTTGGSVLFKVDTGQMSLSLDSNTCHNLNYQEQMSAKLESP